MEGQNSRVPARKIETGLLVCGGGVAGLTAFAYAAELGADVLLIEKNAHPSLMHNDVAAIGSALQKEQGVSIDVDELVRQMSMYSMGYANQALIRIWAAESGEMADWYADIARKVGGEPYLQAGYEMDVEPGAYSKVPTSHRVRWPEGVSSGQAMLDHGLENGGSALFGTSLVDLVKSDGRVVGAIAYNSGDDEYIQIDAKYGVIVATGGYGGNRDMVAQLQPHTLETVAFTCEGRHIAGDGISACLRAGAVMDAVHTSMVFNRCCIMPDETPATAAHPGQPIELGTQPFLWVDLKGRRFMNESSPYDFALHQAQALPGKCYAVVFDSNYREDARRFEMIGCSRLFPFPNGSPSNYRIEDIEIKLERLAESGYVVKAETIEELADGLGLPVESFAGTVVRYNELCAKGVDEDFGKEAYRLAPLAKTPFYGMRIAGVLLSTLDGIQIDANTNALDEDGNPIEGLFVAGCDSGSYFAGTYPNLIPGACMGRNMTLARHAVSCALSAEVE